MSNVDVPAQPGAFRAARLPHLVDVVFAQSDGELATLEGAVRYRKGDALLAGQAGERWPVARERFFATYEPDAPTQCGADGAYRRREGTVWAWRTDRVLDVVLSNNRGSLRANAGDFVVQFDSGDMGVMPEEIFHYSYRPLPPSSR
jgi:hypothetical protein